MPSNPIKTKASGAASPEPGSDAALKKAVRATQPSRVGGGLLDPHMLWKSLPDAFKKLDPRWMIRNPVMFVVEVGYSAGRSPPGCG
jgi:hypothetical protein